jgi:hypothetical protein
MVMGKICPRCGGHGKMLAMSPAKEDVKQITFTQPE